MAYSGTRPARNASGPSPRLTTAAPTASASSTMSPTWTPSTTSSSGSRRLTGTPPRASTSCSSATRATCRIRRWSSTQSQRFVRTASRHGASSLTSSSGIRRQPGHSIPRDVGQEREQRRAGLLDHGPPDQRAHGHHDGQQHQAQRPSRSGPGSRLLIKQQLLLSRLGVPVEGEFGPKVDAVEMTRRTRDDFSVSAPDFHLSPCFCA